MTKRTDTEHRGVNVFPSTKKLSVQVSLNGLSFSVLDVEARRLETAGRYWFPRAVQEENLRDQIQPVMDQFGLTESSFDQIQLIYQTGRFALVPAELFDQACLPHYLKLNARLESNQWPRFDNLAGDQMYNVYLTYPEVDRWFSEQFEWVDIRHSGSVLIDSFLLHPHWDHRPHCFVRVGIRNMEVVLIREQALLAYNIFPFSNQEDFLYYLLMLMEQSQIDPEEVDVNLFGEVDPDHPFFKLAYRYIRNLHMLDPEYEFEISEEIPLQQLDYTVIQGF